MKNPQISETFNNYFVNKTEELGTYKWENVPPDSIDLADRIKCLTTIQVSKLWKEKYKCSSHFNFEFASFKKVLKYKPNWL